MRTQTDDFYFLIFYYYYYYYLLNSQGFINKSSYKSYDTHSLIQISYPTEPMQMCLWISIKTSEVSLIQQMSQRIQISNDIQDVKQTNDMQTIVRCNHAQSTT
jgi:hypothetical protein